MNNKYFKEKLNILLESDNMKHISIAKKSKTVLNSVQCFQDNSTWKKHAKKATL